MASSYSSLLRVELQATGEHSGSWGTVTNTQLGTILEQAIAGRAVVTHDDTANYALSVANGATDAARQMIIDVGGALTAARNVVCPTSSKFYVVKNSTSGGYAFTFKTTGGTGISVPNGKLMVLICDGTNVVEAFSYSTSEFAAGTKMVFYQASAPTGWTAVAVNDHSLRVVSAGGTGGSTGGTVAFSTAFAAGLASGSTAADLASHTHTGTTGTESADHTHTGTSGGASADHSHTGGGTSSGISANHTHSGTTDGVGDHAHTIEIFNNAPAGAAYGIASTSSLGTCSTGSAGAHSHTFSTGYVSADHTHTYSFTSSGRNVDHTHTTTTGGVSLAHTHSFTSAATGAGGGHTHTLPSFAVKYADVILASKN